MMNEMNFARDVSLDGRGFLANSKGINRRRTAIVFGMGLTAVGVGVAAALFF